MPHLPKGVQSLEEVGRKGKLLIRPEKQAIMASSAIEQIRVKEPSKALPKGVQSLADIARKRGRGGQLLRMERESIPALGVPETSTGERHAIRSQRIVSQVTSGELEELKLQHQARKALVKRDLAKPIAALKLASKAGKLLGVAGLPFQYAEFREQMKKPRLHEREQKASGMRM